MITSQTFRSSSFASLMVQPGGGLVWMSPSSFMIRLFAMIAVVERSVLSDRWLFERRSTLSEDSR